MMRAYETIRYYLAWIFPLLCCGCVLMSMLCWIQSYSRLDFIMRYRATSPDPLGAIHVSSVESLKGRLTFTDYELHALGDEMQASEQAGIRKRLVDRGWFHGHRDFAATGVSITDAFFPRLSGIVASRNNYLRLIGVAVPYWTACGGSVLVLMLSLLPLQTQMRFQSRRRSGRCTNCGYDLRASQTLCPECGAGVSKNIRHSTH